MTKEEFLEYANIENIKEEDWKKIELVYMYYPSISNTNGKSEIATLFRIGDMTIINDMLDRAVAAKELDTMSRNIAAIQNQLQELQNDLNDQGNVAEILEKATEILEKANGINKQWIDCIPLPMPSNNA